jgi:hypothetical protein
MRGVVVKPLVTAKNAVGYAVLPGLVPRIRDLFFSGFGALSWYMAVIMAMVRLLPADHPYLQRRFFGTYGVRHVLAAAGHNLNWSWKHADQILIYLAILSGTVILFLYMVSLIFFALTSPAWAAGFGFTIGNMFVTAHPEKDVAFVMMDRTLGLPGLFNSDVTKNPLEYGPFPSVTQIALHGLFGFYNAALFMIAIVIFLFMIIEVVLETSVTGRPFGQRFQNAWVPFRVIAALGLMIPVAYGLNGAQWITLYVAKMGSGLATNAWIIYNTATNINPTGMAGNNLVAKPGIPEKEYADITRQLLMIRACMGVYHGYDNLLKQDSSSFSYNSRTPNDPAPDLSLPGIFAVRGDESIAALRPTSDFSSLDGVYKRLRNFYQGGDIRLVAGIRADKFKEQYPGGVYPVCGEVVIPSTGSSKVSQIVQDAYLFAVARLIDQEVDQRNGNGVTREQNLLTEAINRSMYLNMSLAQSARLEFRSVFAEVNQPGYSYCIHDFEDDYLQNIEGSNAPEIGDCTKPVPPSFWQSTLTKYKAVFAVGPLAAWDYYTGKYSASFDSAIAVHSDFYFDTLGDTDPFLMDARLLKYGWGGAGIWYNRIAEVNGHMVTAIFALPRVTRFPDVMQRIAGEKAMTDANVLRAGCGPYEPSTAANIAAQAGKPFSQFDQEQAAVYYATCKALIENEQLLDKTKQPFDDNSPILRGINAIFGTAPLFSFRGNAETHPLAALSFLGKALIEKAVSNLTLAGGSAAFGGLAQIISGQGKPGFKELGESGYAAAKMFTSFAFVGLSVGVLLYYVIPFMPFMYFFFAVGRWVKTIFEALVGVPLWAIAHLKLDGNGFPGKEASSGYFLLLEIFIRPVLTVFSLIAAFAVFSGSLSVLNSIFDLVTGNLTGVDRVMLKALPDSELYKDNPGYVRDVMLYTRGILDQFFYTVMYIIIAYMIGTSSFKLIDIIPDGIMRWSGAGVQTFGPGDIADDHVDNVGSMVAIPTFVLGKKMADDVIDTVYKVPKSVGDFLAEQRGKQADNERAQKLQEIRNAAISKGDPDPVKPELRHIKSENDIK